MGDYLLRIALLLPLVGALAWGSLWLWQRAQTVGGFAARTRTRPVALVGILPLGPGAKLAVVDFAGRQILLAVSRSGIVRLDDDAAGDFHVD